MKTYPTPEEAQAHDHHQEAHRMQDAVGNIHWMSGSTHPKTAPPVPMRVDTHSIDVALAVNAAIETINKERALKTYSKVRVVNILSAKKTTPVLGSTTVQYTMKVQLRKDGGRLEFQQIVVDEQTSLRHPPQSTVSPISEAIVVNPDHAAAASSSPTFSLVSHHIVRSPYSAPRHRASMVFVPAGKVVAASTLIKSMDREKDPVATPPVATPPSATPPSATPPSATPPALL
jgi:hypothetical protein